MPVLEALHDIIISNEMVLVRSCLEWCCKDCIGVTRICNHDVLIAASRMYQESASIIGVQLGNRLNSNVQFIDTQVLSEYRSGLRIRYRYRNRHSRYLRLSGP